MALIGLLNARFKWGLRKLPNHDTDEPVANYNHERTAVTIQTNDKDLGVLLEELRYHWKNVELVYDVVIGMWIVRNYTPQEHQTPPVPGDFRFSEFKSVNPRKAVVEAIESL